MNRLRSAFWPVALFVFAASLAACSGGGAGTPSVAPVNGNQPPPPSGGAAPYTYALGNAHYQKVLPANEVPAITTNSPFDLVFFGGPVVTSLVSHDININCAASCWGTAGRGTANTFLNNLATSNIIHVVDQYVGSTANDRYTVGPDTNVTKTLPNPLMLTDLIALVHDSAKAAKSTGYHNEVHLFFPKGQDICLDKNTCYSPDVPATFVFCAFHNSVTFSDIGHVLFSVEPYQFVARCALPTGVPHGVIDATSSTLSHELFETITDPDPGAGWFNTVFGFEIGDECSGMEHDDMITSTFYNIQSEYSNAAHDCVNGV
jgi:hypothetical protein